MKFCEERPCLAPRVRLQRDSVTGDPVLLYPEGILLLNETAHALVVRCDGQTSLDTIVESLAAEYEISRSEIESDVDGCMTDLLARNLLILTT